MLIVGHSRLKARKRCHRLYNYRYRQFLVPIRPKLPLIRGTILHKLMEAQAKKTSIPDVLAEYEEQYGKLFREEREEYGDLIGDCEKIFEAYAARYKNDGLQVIDAEREIRIEIIAGKATFKGTIDRVLLDRKTKLRWVLDSKSHKAIPGEEARFYDVQLGCFYFWAWNEENPKRQASGVIWDYLRTKLPSTPEILKSGQLSKRSNIDTTYDHAYAVVIEHCENTGEDPDNYAEWLEGLKGREEKFFKRVYLPSPPRVMIDTIVNEMRQTAADILANPDSDVRTMVNGPMGCQTCEFRDLCIAELRGQDSDYVRKASFKVDEDAMEEEFSEED
jgi:hypothetical protein